ncbi:hypothetical protein B7P43_G07957 [Cryptotermes secundus]|uniref:DUF4817 domain-containing protein n=1 Tax=Cryptotermes secundus TaxID=105785 RepID=A0A2J7Q8S7_9NEOP|nr:hypothetical protein B7P43_G07957 [Cryptotermes secundus]
MQHKVFCIHEFSKVESATAMQRAFRPKFNIQPPTRKSIYRWNKQFHETGSLCKGKSPGQSHVSEENAEHIRVSFERSQMKSTHSTSRELGLSQTTVWGVLRCRLVYKPYHLQLAQALHANDKVKHVEFCDCMLKNREDELFLPRVTFSDKATFHLSGKVNRHTVRIWGLQNPRVTLEHVRDSPKVNVFSALSLTKVYGPFYFYENTVTGVKNLRMLQNWLVPQMNEDSGAYIFQQDGAPSHWPLNVRCFLNESLPQQWRGRMGNEDLALQFWPPRSPDLTP